MLYGKTGRMVAGVLASLGCALAFTVMSICARKLAPMSPGELTFLRGLVGLVFIPLMCLVTGERFFTGTHKGTLILRGLFGSAGLFFYFLSIEGLTLGDGQILCQLAAFFMGILTPLFLKERLPREALPGMASIAAGTMIVVQIWNYSAFDIYALWGIMGAFCCACAYIAINRLAEEGFHENAEIVFYFQVFGVLLGLFLAGSDLIMPRGVQWIWVLGMGLSALLAQMLMTWAFQQINGMIVSFVLYTEILFHAVAGWILWDEVMPATSWIGGILIVLGSVLLMIQKRRT